MHAVAASVHLMRALVAFAVVSLVAGCDKLFDLEGLLPYSDGHDDGHGDGVMPSCFGAFSTPICPDVHPPLLWSVDTPTVIDTDNGTSCDLTVDPSNGGRMLCVRLATSIVIHSSLRATGLRPLVLLAISDILIDSGGSIDIASHVRSTDGAGGNAMQCESALGGTADTNGGGGGAGGSFQSAGGAGGGGGNGQSAGGGANMGVAQPTFLRGGCPGGLGGTGNGTSGGIPGSSGGVVDVIAGGEIVVKGLINANGAGAAVSVSPLAGGSGGGSGGMIVLDGHHVVVETGARVVALGGSGASGAPSMAAGNSGSDPVPLDAPMGPPGGASTTGGYGGDGSKPLNAGAGGNGTEGGGGGGGGGGYVVIVSTVAKTIMPGTVYP